jgi:UDPglucose 6-dehydrogenase
LSGGMGDGGGCHPRDNIALSWLSDELGLKFNWFDNIMKQREVQTDWLCDLIEEHINEFDIITEEIFHKKILILGKSFKPETNLTAGSPSILLKNLLEERGYNVIHYDPHVDKYKLPSDTEPTVYFIGTKHPEFTTWNFNKGSVVIDPWRYIPKQDGIKVIHIGDNLI